MPRKTAGDNSTPRRRHSAENIAIKAERGRGWAMRLLLYSPKDMVAGALAFAAASAIVANALFLQAGHHPSPMFGPAVATSAVALAPASPLPRPRPVEADTPLSGPRSADLKSGESSKSAEAKPVDPKLSDPMIDLVRATSVPATAPTPIARPPAPIALPSRTESIASSSSHRVAAVQRALTEYGYGQLNPTGSVGAETQAAITKFERERKLPITGQMSDRLVRELSAMIGHSID